MTTKINEYGFRQLDPIPTDERLQQFYESEYYHLIKAGGRANELRRLMEGGESARGEVEWLRQTLYADCVDAILDHSDVAAPVLDIGCGTGNLVEYMSEVGLEAEGIEPSQEAAKIGKERGLKVRQATLEVAASEVEAGGRYRAVTMLNVLEHVPDPIGFLKTSRSLLAKGGLLILRVPNDYTEIQKVAEQLSTRKQWWVANPDHINYFSAKSIRTVFNELGFEVVDLFADFPMEIFILLGMNYVDEPSLGPELHKMRCSFELNVPKQFRRSMYRKLTELDIGRNLFVVGRLIK
jgi:2-polyprenyl-3-methyl-5-hydroxy-6-metoxy-1,4-benzoquinol methylase